VEEEQWPSRLQPNPKHVEILLGMVRQRDLRKNTICGIDVHPLLEDFASAAKLAGREMSSFHITYEFMPSPHKRPRTRARART